MTSHAAGGGSLQRRLLVAAFGVILAALVVAGLSIGFVLHRFVRGQIDGRLDDRILSLLSDLRPDGSGGLSLGRDLDGPPFDRPRSGWYWEVRRGRDVLRSASLEGRDLQLPVETRETPLADERIRPGDGTGPWGERLVLRVRATSGQPGAVGTTIVASAPADALNGPVLEAFRALALSLALVAALLVGGALLQVRLGLRPLDRLRRQVAAVRAGHAPLLPDGQPAELRPLAAEMNALLAQNAAQLEGARAQLANLAHGLKTPLATLALALSDATGTGRRDLAGLVEGIDRRLRHHLRRARSAALAGAARRRTPLLPRIEDLAAALARLQADKPIVFEIDVPGELAAACDGEDVDEMIGNLVENACRWCRGIVRITAGRDGTRVGVVVADDGPGLAPQAIDEVMRRGGRLDESVPGHGFGLPITAELAGLYGGSLALGRSTLGGLQVTLTLPG